MEPKFVKIQEIVLYNIAKSQKLCSVNNIINLTGNFLNEKQILNAINNLENRNLIIKNKKGKNIIIGLNLRQIMRIKKILREHWENNWEEKWKKILEKNAQ